MDKWDLNEIAALMEESGALAMEMSRCLKAEFKSDHSIVTDADKAVEKLLSKEFDRPAEGVRLIGEETSASKSEAYVEAALKGSAWIVDPIDGTAPFAHNIPLWGVSIGFMQGGVLKEGAIFMPPLGEFVGSCDGVAYRADAGLGKSSKWGLSKLLKPLKRPDVKFDEGGIVNVSQRMARKGIVDLPNPVHSLCSCVYSSASLMTGRHIAYVFSAKIWDMAGALPSLKNLGFQAILQNGEDLMDLRVRPEVYELGKDASNPWHIHGHTIIAKDREIVDKVRAACVFP